MNACMPPKDAGTARQENSFFHLLPQDITVVCDRKAFFVEFCRGKNVLHIGCVGSGNIEDRLGDGSHLHARVEKVANKAFGVDINAQGIETLRKAGYGDCLCLDIEKEKIAPDLVHDMDVIIIPEVLEHLSNMGAFLDRLKGCSFQGDILISVPNAFSLRVRELVENSHIELVHPDHNCYFSPITLKTVLEKSGFITKKQWLYYWPTADCIGDKIAAAVKRNPYVAEGIICMVKDEKYDQDEISNEEALEEGEVLFHCGDYNGAEQCFSEALTKNEKDKVAWNNLGVLAFLRQDYVQAMEYVKRALKIDPLYTDALENLTDILERAKSEEKEATSLVTSKKPASRRASLVSENHHGLGPAHGSKKGPSWRIYYSPGVSRHGQNVAKMLRLRNYVPSLDWKAPVWFFGLYFDCDYLQLKAHEGKKIVNWRGSDALRLQEHPDRISLVRSVEALHVCQSHRQEEILRCLGIPSIIRPMYNGDVDTICITPFPTKSLEVLVFWREGIDAFIGADLFFQVASRRPDAVFHVVGDGDPVRFNEPWMKNIVFHGWVDEPTLDEIMDRCKGTMRPWRSDGTPNIQSKMLLKGRYAAHYCKFEKVTVCKTVEEYVAWLDGLKDVTVPNVEGRQWWRTHLNHFDFLEECFHPFR